MKKLICLLSIFVIGAFSIQGQTAPADAAPKITVGKYKWSKKTKYPRIFNGADPMPSDMDKNKPIIEPVNIPPNGGMKEIFVYEAEVKNESGRELKGFVWEYIFMNSDGTKELQRNEFFYPYEVGKNKKANARNEHTTPPLPVINVGDLKNGSSQVSERVEIKCVIFEDDSTWKRDDASERACQYLGSTIRKRAEQKKRAGY